MACDTLAGARDAGACSDAGAAGTAPTRTDAPTLTTDAEHALVFAAGGFDTTRDHLRAIADVETVAFLLARPVPTPRGGWRLLVYDRMDVAPDEYGVRTAVRAEVSSDVVGRVLQRARRERAAVVLAHSHTHAGRVEPSTTDRNGEALLLRALRQRVPDVPHARLIVGPDAVHAALFLPDGGEVSVRIADVGRNLLLLTASQSDGTAQTGDEPGVFDRQVRAFGAEGQMRLAALRVGIVGLGGTGSVAAQQLAHLGVRHFLLLDPDRLEPSNLNRVVGSRPRDVGVPKVESARRMIREINPGAVVTALKADVRDASVVRSLLDVDVVVCCTDSHGSRAVLTQFAYQYLVPTLDIGVAIRVDHGLATHVTGRTQLLTPGLACLLCEAALDAEAVRRDLLSDEARQADPYIVGAPVPQPAVISINSATVSFGVSILLAMVTGMPLDARHQRIQFDRGVTRSVGSTPDPHCVVCGTAGAYARGDSWPRPGRACARADEPLGASLATGIDGAAAAS